MAERRPITARDVKSNVEGYSEMSDEAFARRFYSDRAELLALGVPLQSQRDELADRTVNPYALLPDNGIWYVVGYDLDRDDIRTFRVSRIRGEIKFATRRERDFRTPVEFDIELYRGRPPWQVGDIIGEARIEVPGETAWWVQRAYGSTGRLEEGVFITDYSSLSQLASWVLRQDGRAMPLEPEKLRREVATALR